MYSFKNNRYRFMFEVSKPDDIPVDVSKEIDELDGTVDMSDGLDADEAVRYLEISKIKTAVSAVLSQSASMTEPDRLSVIKSIVDIIKKEGASSAELQIAHESLITKLNSLSSSDPEIKAVTENIPIDRSLSFKDQNVFDFPKNLTQKLKFLNANVKPLLEQSEVFLLAGANKYLVSKNGDSYKLKSLSATNPSEESFSSWEGLTGVSTKLAALNSDKITVSTLNRASFPKNATMKSVTKYFNKLKDSSFVIRGEGTVYYVKKVLEGDKKGQFSIYKDTKDQQFATTVKDLYDLVMPERAKTPITVEPLPDTDRLSALDELISDNFAFLGRGFEVKIKTREAEEIISINRTENGEIVIKGSNKGESAFDYLDRIGFESVIDSKDIEFNGLKDFSMEKKLLIKEGDDITISGNPNNRSWVFQRAEGMKEKDSFVLVAKSQAEEDVSHQYLFSEFESVVKRVQVEAIRAGITDLTASTEDTEHGNRIMEQYKDSHEVTFGSEDREQDKVLKLGRVLHLHLSKSQSVGVKTGSETIRVSKVDGDPDACFVYVPGNKVRQTSISQVIIDLAALNVPVEISSKPLVSAFAAPQIMRLDRAKANISDYYKHLSHMMEGAKRVDLQFLEDDNLFCYCVEPSDSGFKIRERSGVESTLGTLDFSSLESVSEWLFKASEGSKKPVEFSTQQMDSVYESIGSTLGSIDFKENEMVVIRGFRDSGFVELNLYKEKVGEKFVLKVENPDGGNASNYSKGLVGDFFTGVTAPLTYEKRDRNPVANDNQKDLSKLNVNQSAVLEAMFKANSAQMQSGDSFLIKAKDRTLKLQKFKKGWKMSEDGAPVMNTEYSDLKDLHLASCLWANSSYSAEESDSSKEFQIIQESFVPDIKQVLVKGIISFLDKEVDVMSADTESILRERGVTIKKGTKIIADNEVKVVNPFLSVGSTEDETSDLDEMPPGIPKVLGYSRKDLQGPFYTRDLFEDPVAPITNEGRGDNRIIQISITSADQGEYVEIKSYPDGSFAIESQKRGDAMRKENLDSRSKVIRRLDIGGPCDVVFSSSIIPKATKH